MWIPQVILHPEITADMCDAADRGSRMVFLAQIVVENEQNKITFLLSEAGYLIVFSRNLCDDGRRFHLNFDICQWRHSPYSRAVLIAFVPVLFSVALSCLEEIRRRTARRGGDLGRAETREETKQKQGVITRTSARGPVVGGTTRSRPWRIFCVSEGGINARTAILSLSRTICTTRIQRINRKIREDGRFFGHSLLNGSL